MTEKRRIRSCVHPLANHVGMLKIVHQCLGQLYCNHMHKPFTLFFLKKINHLKNNKNNTHQKLLYLKIRLKHTQHRRNAPTVFPTKIKVITCYFQKNMFNFWKLPTYRKTGRTGRKRCSDINEEIDFSVWRGTIFYMS